MYHCRIRFYFTGRRSKIYTIVKGFAPPDNFTYEFIESEKPDPAEVAAANVIFADYSDYSSVEELKSTFASKKHDAELILLADKNADIFLNRYIVDSRGSTLTRLSTIYLFWFGSRQRTAFTKR